MLDAIGAGLAPRIGDRDWGDLWQESDEFVRIKEAIDGIKRDVAGKSSQEAQKEYATPTWHQIKKVVTRQSIAFWRQPVSCVYLRSSGSILLREPTSHYSPSSYCDIPLVH